MKNSKITLETSKEQSKAMEVVSENIQDSVHIVESVSRVDGRFKINISKYLIEGAVAQRNPITIYCLEV